MMKRYQNTFIMILTFILVFTFSFYGFSKDANVKFGVKCGYIIWFQETLYIAKANIPTVPISAWNLYHDLKIIVVLSDADYRKLRGKWLGLTFRKGNHYIDAPPQRVWHKKITFTFSYDEYGNKFEPGIYEVTIAGWENYDRASNKMIGEIFRLNWNGKIWMPLLELF